MRRVIFPVLLGLIGVAILIALGVWQVQRLTWKESVLAQIEARFMQPSVALPADPTEGDDEYRPVEVQGTLLPAEILVLVSVEDVGASYRVIRPLETETGRRVLIDLGYIRLEAERDDRPEARIEVTGNLLWPDEVDGWTPEPDAGRGLWFARDLPAMAAALDSEAVLVVARTILGEDAGTTPLPINTAAIPNDHLNYAITWFLLALVWAVMSGILIRRTLGQKD